MSDEARAALVLTELNALERQVPSLPEHISRFLRQCLGTGRVQGGIDAVIDTFILR
jgi:hypothetical protein